MPLLAARTRGAGKMRECYDAALFRLLFFQRWPLIITSFLRFDFRRFDAFSRFHADIFRHCSFFAADYFRHAIPPFFIIFIFITLITTMIIIDFPERHFLLPPPLFSTLPVQRQMPVFFITPAFHAAAQPLMPLSAIFHFAISRHYHFTADIDADIIAAIFDATISMMPLSLAADFRFR
jgi:hypothetical protein